MKNSEGMFVAEREQEGQRERLEGHCLAGSPSQAYIPPPQQGIFQESLGTEDRALGVPCEPKSCSTHTEKASATSYRRELALGMFGDS